MSAQAIVARIIAVVILIGLWNQLSHTRWFALPSKITNGQEMSGRVLSGTDAAVVSHPTFISAQEAALRLSPQEQGIFLYVNAEGKFYPEHVLQNLQEVKDSMEGFTFTIVPQKGALNTRVVFDAADHPAYEYISFQEARTLLPELIVFFPDQIK